MNDLQTNIHNYLEYCKNQKCLDRKTLKSYRIDLRQFAEQSTVTEGFFLKYPFLKHMAA